MLKSQRLDLAHQSKRVPVSDGRHIHVDGGQGKAGTLQKGAQIAQIGEWGDAQTGTAGDVGFRGKPGIAQFQKCPAGKQAAEKESIRPQCSADLGEAARHIIDAVEAEQADDAIEALVSQRHGLIIEDKIDIRFPGRGCGQDLAVARQRHAHCYSIRDGDSARRLVPSGLPNVDALAGHRRRAQLIMCSSSRVPSGACRVSRSASIV